MTLEPLDLVIILIVALLLFGPTRLPQIGRGLGDTIRQFREAMQSGEEEARKAQASTPKGAVEAGEERKP